MTDQSTETIFEETKTEDQPVTKVADQQPVVKAPQPDIDSIFKDQLNSITDEAGEQKYKDVMTALEALKHSQNHIKTLQEENLQYRESQVEQQTLEQALQNVSANTEVQAPTSQETKIDAEQLKGITLDTLMEYEKGKTEAANKQAVEDTLVNHFGDSEKAKKALVDRATELGVEVSVMSSLAAKSPAAALAYFNISPSTSKPSKEGSINTEALGKTNTTSEVDYRARYYQTSSPAATKWANAGKSLNS